MPRFALDKDIKFFESISRELVDAVIETTVVLFKLSIEDISTNIYGESLNKSYYQGTQCSAVIERDDSSVSYEGFGPDSGQSVEFRFNRFTLKDKSFYPEIGDIIMISHRLCQQVFGGHFWSWLRWLSSLYPHMKNVSTQIRILFL